MLFADPPELEKICVDPGHMLAKFTHVHDSWLSCVVCLFVFFAVFFGWGLMCVRPVSGCTFLCSPPCAWWRELVECEQRYLFMFSCTAGTGSKVWSRGFGVLPRACAPQRSCWRSWMFSLAWPRPPSSAVLSVWLTLDPEANQASWCLETILVRSNPASVSTLCLYGSAESLCCSHLVPLCPLVLRRCPFRLPA